MEQNNFNSSFTANVSAAEAIKKIGNVPDWWGITFTGNSEKLNDKFVVKMGGDSSFDLTISELVPGKKVVWTVTDCYMPWFTDKKEWAGTKMIFDVNESNGNSEVNFTHEGLTPQVECYNDCVSGWTHWIKTSLSSYLTTGKGVFRAPTK